jgi:hypothetical protein
MPDEQILTTILGGNENARLEVALGVDSQSGRTLELRRLSWGEGVGWFYQQTLRLDSTEAENLLRALRQNHCKWRDQPEKGPGKVIPFPGNSTSALPGGEKRGGKREKEKLVTSHA